MSQYQPIPGVIPPFVELLEDYNGDLCGIYLMENVQNGMLYVGRTWRNFRERNRHHLRDTPCSIEEQPLHKAINQFGPDNFTTYVLEYIDKTEDRAYFNERENYWIDALGVKDSNIGYNVYGSPATYNSLDDMAVRDFLAEWENSYEPLSVVAAKYEIQYSTASKIRMGERRWQPGIDYPVWSAGERDDVQTVIDCVELLLTTDLSHKDIEAETGRASTKVGDYNLGKIPDIAWQMRPDYFDQLTFPLRDTNKAKTKVYHSKYVGDIEFDETEGVNASPLSQFDLDYIFELMLDYPDNKVLDILGIDTSVQNLRNYMTKRTYPVTKAGKRALLSAINAR